MPREKIIVQTKVSPSADPSVFRATFEKSLRYLKLDHVDLFRFLRLWTYAKSLGMVDWGRMRYNLLGNGGHWFPGRQADRFDESAMRAVMVDSIFADRIPAILREAHQLLQAAPQKRLSEN